MKRIKYGQKHGKAGGERERAACGTAGTLGHALLRRRAALAAFFVLTAAVIVAICSRSSFLYPLNNWDDVNCYFTIGKAMMNGQVPYRDVFDHKGVYLYFFYGLCTLLSRTSFAGVYVMEVLCAAADLALLYRILRLYVRRGTALCALPLLLAVMFSSRSFYWGGSAEEMILPFLLWPLYLLLRMMRDGRMLRGWEVLSVGLCAGVAANVKFTLLGFFLAWAVLAAWSVMTLRESLAVRLALLAKDMLLFAAGMALATLPWVLYFAAHGAIGDWVQGYLWTNLTHYGVAAEGVQGAARAGFGTWCRSMALLLYWQIRQNWQYFILVIAGLAWIMFRPGTVGRCRRAAAPVKTAGKEEVAGAAGSVNAAGKAEPAGAGREIGQRKGHGVNAAGKVEPAGAAAVVTLPERFAPVLLFGLTFLGIYIGGSELPYYSLPLSIFAVFGFAAAGRAAEMLGERLRERQGVAAWRFPALLLALVLAGALFCYGRTMNRYYLSFDKSDLFQYRFAQTIRRSGIESPTLLNYGCLDAGLFTTADILPRAKWFQAVNMHLPEMDEAQERSVHEGTTDFVLTRDTYPDCILNQYELAEQMTQPMGRDMTHTYFLFRKK